MRATYVDGIMFLKFENYKVRFYKDYASAVDRIESFGYRHYTSSNRRGYIKRSRDKQKTNCLVVPYDGRYGKGFALHVQDKRTAYHYVEYYVK